MNNKTDKLTKVSIDLMCFGMNKETGEVYYGRCIECNKMLNLEERSYGHDCE